jgi:RNA polymerase sigma factor (sigma-70 family)
MVSSAFAQFRSGLQTPSRGRIDLPLGLNVERRVACLKNRLEMKKAARMQDAEWVLTQDAFHKVLDWLDRDIGKAAAKYEEIRAALIQLFQRRGCVVAEELADETIDRVIRKMDKIREGYKGNPAPYFYGVAQMIHLEYLRRKPESMEPVSPHSLDYTEQDYDCLERCLGLLTRQSRELIETYYQHDGKAKMSSRKELAHSIGVSLNILRVRTHRIRDQLRNCVEECRRRKATSNESID